MIKKIAILLFSLMGIFSFSQNVKKTEEHIYKLPVSIKQVDTDNDELISKDEAVILFDQYFLNTPCNSRTNLDPELESVIIDLISYLEAVNCNDFKKISATRRFIEIYYLKTFHPQEDISFGLRMGFIENEVDSSYVSEPLHLIKKK